MLFYLWWYYWNVSKSKPFKGAEMLLTYFVFEKKTIIETIQAQLEI